MAGVIYFAKNFASYLQIENAPHIFINMPRRFGYMGYVMAVLICIASHLKQLRSLNP